MKTTNGPKFGMVLLLAGGVVLAAQTPASVPVDQEPQHKIVFKNDFVRIIDATLPAGYTTLNHAHDADHVSVTIANGREGDAGKQGLGRAAFNKGGFAHTVRNTGAAIMRYIVVEPFKSDKPGTEGVVLPNHVLQTENERVRIYRLVLPMGMPLEKHSHATGHVEVTVFGASGAGNAVWIPGGDNHALKAAAESSTEIVEIEPK